MPSFSMSQADPVLRMKRPKKLGTMPRKAISGDFTIFFMVCMTGIPSAIRMVLITSVTVEVAVIQAATFVPVAI